MPVRAAVRAPEVGRRSPRCTEIWSSRPCRQPSGFVPSISRRGNCYANAAVESFFASAKKERVRRRTYRTRDDARANVFD